MSTTNKLTDLDLDAMDPDPQIMLDMDLREAEALRAWLAKATADGASSLDDPFVSGTLGRLGRQIDAFHAIANVRRELEQAGLDVAHLTDEHVRDLSRRVSDAAAPVIRG